MITDSERMIKCFSQDPSKVDIEELYQLDTTDPLKPDTCIKPDTDNKNKTRQAWQSCPLLYPEDL